jgi:hypothetical protein
MDLAVTLFVVCLLVRHTARVDVLFEGWKVLHFDQKSVGISCRLMCEPRKRLPNYLPSAQETGCNANAACISRARGC